MSPNTAWAIDVGRKLGTIADGARLEYGRWAVSASLSNFRDSHGRALLSRYTTESLIPPSVGCGGRLAASRHGENPYYRVGWSRRRAGIGDRASVDGVAQSAPGGTPIGSRVFSRTRHRRE